MAKMQTFLHRGNIALRNCNYEEAIAHFTNALIENPILEKIAQGNIEYAKNKLRHKDKTVQEIASNKKSNRNLDNPNSNYRQSINIGNNKRGNLGNDSFGTESLEADITDYWTPFDVSLSNLLGQYDDLIYIIARIGELNPDLTFETLYRFKYPDISAAIDDRHFETAAQHYDLYGRKEGRLGHVNKFISEFKSIKSNFERDGLNIKNYLNKKSIYVNFKSKKTNYTEKNTLVARPYYVSEDEIENKCMQSSGASIAVHLHLYYEDMLPQFISHLANINREFDLYVSITDYCDKNDLIANLRNDLEFAKRISVEVVPNRGRDIAPFIIQFGSRLLNYDYICHLHSKKSSHDIRLNKWCSDILHNLLGSTIKVTNIINLLEKQAKIIFPEKQPSILRDTSGWGDDFNLAKELLSKFTDIDINDFQTIIFPEGSMFWARTNCIAEFLSLPLKWSDFPEEPIPSDGTLAHALERLIFIFAHKYSGELICSIRNDSELDYRFYENQIDYSDKITEHNIKILSYYLPQFHPTPENDEWHGFGFTEWTKVKASNPLFIGHYQQHIPHEDIGYYLLDSPEILHQQADMMRKSGVYGQIFYHYWFTGKLILEKPALLLLNNKDISMPFCFCWANENWTKKWDGNENEILLAQEYSANDAKNFIDYLIPFFKDDRYIKVEGRPVLYIYRPSSIPNINEYLAIWNLACNQNGIQSLFVVATLTRGATDPNSFMMDAAVERVLHDWTDGAVPAIQDELTMYERFNGNILDYNKVSDHYSNKLPSENFVLYRSVVPMWDNTARYGSEAYVVHGSTPSKFQEWIEKTIDYTANNLPFNQQFIVINAWNEWAEGAHLEPDSRHGYAYLNCIGRALSRIKYRNPNPRIPKLTPSTAVHLSIPAFIINQLENCLRLKIKFFKNLANSTIFLHCSVFVDNEYIATNLKKYGDFRDLRVQNSIPDMYKFEFRTICYIASDCLENMLGSGFNNPNSLIACNTYSNRSLPFVEANSSIDSGVAYNSALVLIPATGYINFKIAGDGLAFLTDIDYFDPQSLEEVTTIIRFHGKADISELRKALYSLYAIHSCLVYPLVAVQDLSEEQLNQIRSLLNSFDWGDGYSRTPQIVTFYGENGKEDLRSTLLNESLKMVNTQYVTFLDYDDLLFPHSFHFLLSRLKTTAKSIAFGRVYVAEYDFQTGFISQRKATYEYNNSYDDFLNLNHAPIHSFMIDVSQIDRSIIKYIPGQKFMEDYYLMLQVVTDSNTDWLSLSLNEYIGDYIHSTTRDHTLAFVDESSRDVVLLDPHYIFCERMICEMRDMIKNTKDSLIELQT